MENYYFESTTEMSIETVSKVILWNVKTFEAAAETKQFQEIRKLSIFRCMRKMKNKREFIRPPMLFIVYSLLPNQFVHYTYSYQ